jgi:hypothetical protein
MAFTYVTVTGVINDSSGNPIPNIPVEFTLSQNLFSTADGAIASCAPQTITTAANGSFSISLAATDDSTTVPRGQIYSCRVYITGGTAVTQFGVNTSFPTYYFALPHAKAPTCTFASLIYS